MDDQEIEEHDESEDYRECEVCDTNVTKIRCFQLQHDLGDKGTLEYFICEDCCEDYLFWDNEYLEDGCMGDCDADTPKIFFENRLKEMSSKLDLKESDKHKGNFLNKSKTVIFGNCTIYKDSYPSFIETNKLIIPSAIFPGEYATFVKNQSGKIKTYDIELIQEVKKLFSEMKENWAEATFYSYDNLLLIRGYYNWALVANTKKTDYLLERESSNFQTLLNNAKQFEFETKTVVFVEGFTDIRTLKAFSKTLLNREINEKAILFLISGSSTALENVGSLLVYAMQGKNVIIIRDNDKENSGKLKERMLQKEAQYRTQARISKQILSDDNFYFYPDYVSSIEYYLLDAKAIVESSNIPESEKEAKIKAIADEINKEKNKLRNGKFRAKTYLESLYKKHFGTYEEVDTAIAIAEKMSKETIQSYTEIVTLINRICN